MELKLGLHVDDVMIADFAARHGIRRLAPYGSVLGDDFNLASDIDILARVPRSSRCPRFGESADLRGGQDPSFAQGIYARAGDRRLGASIQFPDGLEVYPLWRDPQPGNAAARCPE